MEVTVSRPQRAAAAARTREAIVTAATDVFERLGWSGATMRGVADQAGVSVKTVEALYRTKAELLKEAVDYAIAGDLRPIPVLGREPAAARRGARYGRFGVLTGSAIFVRVTPYQSLLGPNPIK